MDRQLIWVDWRRRLGTLGAYGAAIAFMCGFIVFCMLEASFADWSVGKYFTSRGGNFVDSFLLLLAISLFTLLFSSCGRGKQRVFGIAVSIFNAAAILLIFGSNR